MGQINRDDYRRVKKMNREEFTAYLQRVYLRGYHKGIEDTTKAVKPTEEKTPDVPAD